MNAVAHVHVEATGFAKERFVTGGSAAIAMAGGLILRIRLRFHHHTPEQAAVVLLFHQPAAHQIRSHHLLLGGRRTRGAGLGNWK